MSLGTGLPGSEATHLPRRALLRAGRRGVPGRAHLEAHALDDGARVQAGLQEQLQQQEQQQHVVRLLVAEKGVSSGAARPSWPFPRCDP